MRQIKAEPPIAAAVVDPDQFPRLAGYSSAAAALADIQPNLPEVIFHEWMEGGLRMAARVYPGNGTFRDITMKLAMAEGRRLRRLRPTSL